MEWHNQESHRHGAWSFLAVPVAEG